METASSPASILNTRINQVGAGTGDECLPTVAPCGTQPACASPMGQRQPKADSLALSGVQKSVASKGGESG